MRNESEELVAFKWRATNNEGFAVTPSTGVLHGGDGCIIKIRMKTGCRPANRKKPDRFQLIAVRV